jgi:hypothetical protein
LERSFLDIYGLFVQKLGIHLDLVVIDHQIANPRTNRRHGETRRMTMNRYRLFMLGTILLFAFATKAQQPPTSVAPAKGTSGAEDPGLPTVEAQLKVLTEKLGLTSDQQVKIKPIVQELHDATLKLMQDGELTHEERLEKVRPVRFNADKKIREILNDDQKKKLDQYEQGPHREMHGNLEPKTKP